MKIILFGSTGMLGNYVHKVLSVTNEVICLTRKDFDICSDNWEKLTHLVNQKLNADDIIINCAGLDVVYLALNSIELSIF